MAIAVYIWAAIERVKECRAGYWTIVLGALSGFLYYWGSLGHYGVLPLCCSLFGYYVLVGRGAGLLPVHGKAVLVTGCDTGFGHALAKLLSDMGVTVFAGVLDEDGAGAQGLRRHSSKDLQVLQLDVTDHSQIEQAHRYVCSHVGEKGLWGLVNNAGILGYPADGELQPLATYRRCMDVNFMSTVEMCQVFLPLLRKSRGRIVNMLSMAGEVPMPMLCAYGASKAALGNFSRVMKMELDAWGVKVAIVQPSGFRTNIFNSDKEWSCHQEEILSNLPSDTREDYGEEYISSLRGCLLEMANQSLEDLRPVLKDICHALMSVAPKSLYTPGRGGWLLPFFYRICPNAISDVILKRLFKLVDAQPEGLRMKVSGTE
ncbi:estradiol 17-beta-dehydrogenase 2 [Lampris incognitus]|uniref:estradiol 17-beta-dehydrogenase 2 n=1 Tax=Lampris incognitus TaxID=2546036 RepID=UPI0024B55F42|nr:estradiol 17-beta-dehydrogenase 2 [Lampris incognitus]